jgi:hypothetical protein
LTASLLPIKLSLCSEASARSRIVARGCDRFEAAFPIGHHPPTGDSLPATRKPV